MKKLPLLLLLLAFCLPLFAQEGARDAVAVLNRCGKPLKGDETLYTNTVSTRTLEYERGTLHFERVGNDGWKFTSGDHKKQKGLNAEQMAAFMPCLPLGLADSAAPGPLKVVTPVERIEVSAKHSMKEVILFTLVGLALLGVFFYVWSKRSNEEDAD